MMLNDWRQAKEDYEARLAEAEARRRENALLASAKSRRQGKHSWPVELLRGLRLL